MKAIPRWLPRWVLLLPIVLSATACAQAPVGEPYPYPEGAAYRESYRFTTQELEQLVAPIALYPDALVAQVLMAATYPLQVVQAARWQARNDHLTAESLDRAVAYEDWDPSVKALLHFPDLLRRMNDNLDWTQDLGDAVLAQQEEVMEVIQQMRRYAYDAGNLGSSERQVVVVEERIIRVSPVTEVIYLPAYNPVVVYGSRWQPHGHRYRVYDAPPAYWYPSGYAASNVVAFGLGVAVGSTIWADCDWHGRRIGHQRHYDRHDGGSHGGGPDPHDDRRPNDGSRDRDRDRRDFEPWQHNPTYRQGVRYRDLSTERKYDAIRRANKDRPKGVDPDEARGYDRPRGAEQRREEQLDRFRRNLKDDNSNPLIEVPPGRPDPRGSEGQQDRGQDRGQDRSSVRPADAPAVGRGEPPEERPHGRPLADGRGQQTQPGSDLQGNQDGAIRSQQREAQLERIRKSLDEQATRRHGESAKATPAAAPPPPPADRQGGRISAVPPKSVPAAEPARPGARPPVAATPQGARIERRPEDIERARSAHQGGVRPGVPSAGGQENVFRKGDGGIERAASQRGATSRDGKSAEAKKENAEKRRERESKGDEEEQDKGR
jgi:hypothetical protein